MGLVSNFDWHCKVTQTILVLFLRHYNFHNLKTFITTVMSVGERDVMHCWLLGGGLKTPNSMWTAHSFKWYSHWSKKFTGIELLQRKIKFDRIDINNPLNSKDRCLKKTRYLKSFLERGGCNRACQLNVTFSQCIKLAWNCHS